MAKKLLFLLNFIPAVFFSVLYWNLRSRFSKQHLWIWLSQRYPLRFCFCYKRCLVLFLSFPALYHMFVWCSNHFQKTVDDWHSLITCRTAFIKSLLCLSFSVTTVTEKFFSCWDILKDLLRYWLKWISTVLIRELVNFINISIKFSKFFCCSCP